MLPVRRSRLRGFLAVAGALSVLYSLLVVLVAATAPDLRLRWLLVEDDGERGGNGILLRQCDEVVTRGPRPEPGDRLLRIADHRVVASIDAAAYILRQVHRPVSVFSWAHGGDSEDGWVEVAFRRSSTGETLTTAVAVQAVPSFEIGVTLVWLVGQLGIFGLGALAFWRRPFDRPVRIFFAMCLVTLGAFVGGYHWWILSGSFLLSLPFVVCALLVPSVTLHFFLIYPQPKPCMEHRRTLCLRLLYMPPLLAAVSFSVIELFAWSQLMHSSPVAVGRAVSSLMILRTGIYGYLVLAAAYFLGTLVCLVHSVLNTRQILERRQVASILWAGLVASLCIGYTLILAGLDRVAFALGGARVPMFLSSMVFMVAYAVGIVRYKLMLTDETFSRNFMIGVLRLLGALTVGLVVVPLSLELGSRSSGLPWMPTLAVAVVLVVVVVAVLACRDALQRGLERRLFRERYRLDKALQRIHRAVGQLADPQFLSGRTLAACCEVLQAEWAALYLRESVKADSFRLIGADGAMADLPFQWTPPAGFLETLEAEAGLFSAFGERQDESSVLAAGLEQLRGDLIHRLEIDGEAQGLVVLGPKLGGGLYSHEDTTFLTAMSQLTGVALHCVQVHQDLTQLNEQLRGKVERIAQQKQQILLLQAELAATRTEAAVPDEQSFKREAIRGSSEAIMQILTIAEKAAASDATVLIRGESGTGKELLARAIHENSPRRHGPLIVVHCAALAPSLLESELFGHVKGAFTGASTDRRGRIELAHGGTLFLDEIGEISQETQVKLLRVLQQHEIEPVGSSQPVAVDVRIVAATHRPLESMIADGRFREDLYYRLNVISMTLPPLRERREDLQELATQFLRYAAQKLDKRVVDFEEEAWDALLDYSWPGNIRELENVIERAVVLTDSDLVRLVDLPRDLVEKSQTPSGAGQSASHAKVSRDRRELLSEKVRTGSMTSPVGNERAILLEALQKCGGNKAQAAKLLGLARSTFFSKLKKYALQK